MRKYRKTLLWLMNRNELFRRNIIISDVPWLIINSIFNFNSKFRSQEGCRRYHVGCHGGDTVDIYAIIVAMHCSMNNLCVFIAW